MQRVRTLLRIISGGLLLGSSLLFDGCKQVCGENVPEYSLSAAQRAWGAPYVVGTVWRFRNAAGTERTYRVSSFHTDLVGSGGNRPLTPCSTSFREYAFADLERTDTVQTTVTRELYHLELSATPPDGNTDNFLQWNYQGFTLPIDEIEAGRLILPSATFGGRTYASVLTATNTTFAPVVLHLYLTKADGVVAFDDRYGTLWTRQ